MAYAVGSTSEKGVYAVGFAKYVFPVVSVGNPRARLDIINPPKSIRSGSGWLVYLSDTVNEITLIRTLDEAVKLCWHDPVIRWGLDTGTVVVPAVGAITNWNIIVALYA